MKLRIDHFDFIARHYDRLIRPRADDPVPRLLAPEAGQLVLDVGGGTGRISGALHRDGCRVVVCDFSAAMARQAHAKGLPATVGSVVHLPFADGTADRILVVDAFHHFIHPAPHVAQPAAAGEILRVLKRGGRLVIVEPDIRCREVKLLALMERALLMRSRFLTPAALADLFTAAGGRLLSGHDDGFSVVLVFTRG